MRATSRGPSLRTIVGLGLAFSLGTLVPDAPLHAVATDRAEGLLLATGRAASRVEAFDMLEAERGEVRAAVLDPKTRRFTKFFQPNIKSDLRIEEGKRGHYVMVTGDALPAADGQPQLAPTVLYVAETTSGYLATYGLPFDPATLDDPQVTHKGLVLLNVQAFLPTRR